MMRNGTSFLGNLREKSNSPKLFLSLLA